MKKAPAFMFYAKDWLTDLRVRSMTPAQKGHYIDLLATMWLEDGRLPADKELIKSITGANDADIDKVITCFSIKSVNGTDYYVQKRMDEEREKQRLHREQASEASKARWKGHKKQGPLTKAEREAKLAKKAKEFQDRLNDFYKNNKDKYPKEMYKEFFQYWGTPSTAKKPQTLVWEKERSFHLPQRLANWYKNYIKGKPQINADKVTYDVDVKPVNMDD